MSFNCNGNCSSCPFSKAEGKERELIIVRTTGDVGGIAGRTLIHEGCEIRFIADSSQESDVVLDIVDTLSLEQNLEYTAMLLDMDLHLVVALSHYSDYLQTDHSIDIETLSKLFGVPVMPVDFESGTGLRRLADSIIAAAKNAPACKHVPFIRDATIEEARHAFVCGALQETVRHSKDNSDHTLTQKVDALLTNKWLGLPLLVLILFGIFAATFSLGAYPQAWIERGVDLFAGWLRSIMNPGWISSLVVDGVVQGVGAVLAFLPNIVILFMFLSLMEDSGVMARAAFIMDKIMHRIGLHGKSFIPMLLGFGCNVPAIMAAKSIEDKRDRTLTMLMIPFMSCSARLPVYMLFVSAFFVKYKALVMMSMYVAGIILSILFAFVMKRTKYFRKEEDDYVSELPPFRKPKARVTWGHIWERCEDYLQKITTVILAASVVIWALEYFPADRTQDGRFKEESYLADVGRFVEPVMKPIGCDWKMSVCLLTGLPAKEAIVSTMGILYHAEEEGSESLVEVMREDGAFTPAAALAFMLFVLLYFPCIATISTLRRETGWKWAAFTVIHSLLLAWVVAFVVFRTGTLLL